MPFEMPCPDSSKSTAACKARALAPKARAVRKRKNTKDAKGPKTRLLRNVCGRLRSKKVFSGAFSLLTSCVCYCIFIKIKFRLHEA
jgi:hypothetical protein